MLQRGDPRLFRNYRLCTVFGADIWIHSTLLMMVSGYVLHAWLTEGSSEAASALGFITLAFLSVLVHEYGHVAAARLFGVGCGKITLHGLGGLAHLDREPPTPAARLVVAAAGPLTSGLIAVEAYVFAKSLDGGGPGFDLAMSVLVTNILIAVFNLAPAYPLDGGRIFHAILEMVFGERVADALSSVMAQILALVMVAVGIYFVMPTLAVTGALVFLVAPRCLGNRWLWNFWRPKASAP